MANIIDVVVANIRMRNENTSMILPLSIKKACFLTVSAIAEGMKPANKVNVVITRAIMLPHKFSISLDLLTTSVRRIPYFSLTTTTSPRATKCPLTLTSSGSPAFLSSAMTEFLFKLSKGNGR